MQFKPVLFKGQLYIVIIALFYYVFVVNLLLFLIHKLNFILGIYGKNSTYGGTIHGFRHPRGVLEGIPHG